MTLASLSSPNYAGADLSTRVNAILVEARSGRRFLSVASVLSDTTMAYSNGARRVAAGDRVVTANGFAYEVTLSGATNHNLATAGGVKFMVLPEPDGAYNLGAWRVDTTGVTPCHAAFQRAIGRPRTSSAPPPGPRSGSAPTSCSAPTSPSTPRA